MLTFRNRETGEKYQLLIADAFTTLGSFTDNDKLITADPAHLFNFTRKLSKKLIKFINEQLELPHHVHNISFPSFLMVNSFGVLSDPHSRLVDLYLIAPYVTDFIHSKKVYFSESNKRLIDSWLNNQSYAPHLDGLLFIDEFYNEKIILDSFKTGNYCGVISYAPIIDSIKPKLLDILEQSSIPVFLVAKSNEVLDFEFSQYRIPFVLLPFASDDYSKILLLLSKNNNVYTVLPVYNYDLFLKFMNQLESHIAKEKILGQILFSTFFPFSNIDDVTSCLLYLLARFFGTPHIQNIFYRNLLKLIGVFNVYCGENTKNASLQYLGPNKLFARNILFNFLTPFISDSDTAVVKCVRFSNSNSGDINNVAMIISSNRFNLLPLWIDLKNHSLWVLSKNLAEAVYKTRNPILIEKTNIPKVITRTSYELIRSLLNFLKFSRITNTFAFLNKIAFEINYGYVPSNNLFLTRADMTLLNLKEGNIVEIRNLESKKIVYAIVKETTLITNNQALMSPIMGSFLGLKEREWVTLEKYAGKIVPIQHITFTIEPNNLIDTLQSIKQALTDFLKQNKGLILALNQIIYLPYNDNIIAFQIKEIFPLAKDAVYLVDSILLESVDLQIAPKTPLNLIFIFDSSLSGNKEDIRTDDLALFDLSLLKNQISRFDALILIFTMLFKNILKLYPHVASISLATVSNNYHILTFRGKDQVSRNKYIPEQNDDYETFLKLVQNYLGATKEKLNSELTQSALLGSIDALLKNHDEKKIDLIFIFLSSLSISLDELSEKLKDLCRGKSYIINFVVSHEHALSEHYKIDKQIFVFKFGSLKFTILKDWIYRLLLDIFHI